MLMNMIICDDQPEDAKKLESLLSSYFFRLPDSISYHIKICSTGRELLALCEKEVFQAVFLDIDMPNMSGMETANRLRKINEHVFIIFVSSYPQYMRDSFDVQAFHFIEKPIYSDVLNHVCNIMLQKQRKLQDIIITIPTTEGDDLRNVDDLILIEAIKGTKDSLRFYFSSGDILISHGTLAFWEKTLKERGIISPCRGFLINMRHLRIIKNNELHMSNNTVVPASRRRIKQIHELFTDHVLSLIN